MNPRPLPEACLRIILALSLLAFAPAAALAAEGVYYLKTAVSVKTDSGIVSALAGSKVTKVATVPGGLKVKLSDGNLTNVSMNQITNDPAEAQKLVQDERARQAALAAQAQASLSAQAAEEAATRQRLDAVTQQLGQTNVASSGTNSPSLTGSALDAKGSGTATVNHPTKKAPVKNPFAKKKK